MSQSYISNIILNHTKNKINMKNKNVLLILTIVCFVLSIKSTAQNNKKLYYNFPFAPSEGFINRVEKEFRKEICLNGYWDIQPQSLPHNYTMGKGIAPELNMPDETNWSSSKIKIPSPWNINSFANRNLEGPDHRNYPSYPKEWEEARMAWMRKTVTIPANWSNQQIQLHFEAVSGYTEVYINKQKIAENFDIFLPFTINITDFAKPGEQIEILVGVRDQALFEDKSTIGRRIVPAGSMWGYHIRGIWQDVYLIALPQIHIEDIFVKPLVSKNILELDVTIRNHSTQKENISLQGVINEWLNKAGNDINSAPVPAWELGREALNITPHKVTLNGNAVTTTTLQIPVTEGLLDYWTPENPNLYGLTLSMNKKKETIDKKYERFGWREWTISGTKQYLNGKPIELRGDSWHFMGIPQMTRRYAWAWYTSIKNMNANAVRPHAQIYPRFYLDVADEMGICVLNETANWASDGGPKLDSEKFWESSKDHLKRFVLRDRNHASVFGWSISNENKPVILHVYNRPDLMPNQKKAWEDWRNIVMEYDPTRPWISSDGEDDGDGILPVTVGHYGDINSMKRWVEIGKPWGIGEHSMAYYGTPEQVAKYNGEEAYESQYGRMKGIANEVYHLLADQRNNGASYVSVFNMAWYGLKPLPLGKKDLTTKPSLTEDGIYFSDYKEGIPGVQPERIGSYCSTFNPGYDPSLPLYDPWPMYEAMRAANAPGGPEWSPYMELKEQEKHIIKTPLKQYKEVVFIGKEDSPLKQILDAQSVEFTSKTTNTDHLLYLIDGTEVPNQIQKSSIEKNINRGADIWIWGITPETTKEYNKILPLPITLEKRAISSFIPTDKSWVTGLKNSDFYFCEIQKSNASEYGLSGEFVTEGEILLNACNTDWRKWNKRPEELKTAATVRSEQEAKGAAPTFVKYQKGCSTYYISTLSEFANSEKGYNTLAVILKNAGIPCKQNEMNTNDVFFIRDQEIRFPISTQNKFVAHGNDYKLNIWVFSPRPLDDLLIEPNMPKLNLFIDTWESALFLNDKEVKATNKTNRNSTYKELMLHQGWNKLTLTIGKEDINRFSAAFTCDNNNEFLSKVKVSFISQENK